MSITYQVLGNPGDDNAVLMVVDSGQHLTRLLFDCGEACLSSLSFSDVQQVDELFFSHCHMDHVGGFDSYFRANFDRKTRPNRIWGPPDTSRILQHRFQGYTWNLLDELSGTWRICDIHPTHIQTSRYELSEGFAQEHGEGATKHDGLILKLPECSVSALAMDHRTPSMAYLVRETSRSNIDNQKLREMGLSPGPWLKQLKDPSCPPTVMVNGQSMDAEMLRTQLIHTKPGQAVAYLTDFLMDDQAMDRLATWLTGCQTIICESQYRHADLELAKKNFHMTSVLAAKLAHQAGASELVLFHLSQRYERPTWMEMLVEARSIFPNTHFPAHWNL